jgi:hypothetical protein
MKIIKIHETQNSNNSREVAIIFEKLNKKVVDKKTKMDYKITNLNKIHKY